MLDSLAKALNEICWVKNERDNEKLRSTLYLLHVSTATLSGGKVNKY